MSIYDQLAAISGIYHQPESDFHIECHVEDFQEVEIEQPAPVPEVIEIRPAISVRRTTLDEALDVIASYQADVAMQTTLNQRLAALGIPIKLAKPAYKPCPSQPAAISATLYDNWPHGRQAKNKTNRHTLSVKAWDVDTSDLTDPDFVGHCNLMEPDKLISELDRFANPKTKMKHPISTDYDHFLRTEVVPGAKARGLMVGMLFSKPKGEGTIYHDGQYVLVSMADGVISSAVFDTNGGGVQLPAFDTHMANGKPLKQPVDTKGVMKARCLGQSRYCSTNRMAGWVTSVM